MGEGPGKAAIRAAGRRDVTAISRVLGRAFEGDPFVTWMFPDPRERRRRARRLYAIEAGFEYLPHGRVDVAVLDGRVVGAALWGSPHSSTATAALRAAPHLAALFGARMLPTVLQGMARLAEHTPRTPHWYLAELGTDPDVRGAGAGVALLRQGLDRADADGTPVFLESSKAENLPFYARFGFRDAAEVPMPEGPTLHTMVRGAGGGAVPVP
ncbi:GNAT family N-acetyltransferase [Nocardiopsis sp. MG754419]|uniref:GNAT family N-acetyltransferase n=1 Tax=Nocardiopsis sp. MG754419 TaxID=2259865 RepID=UPI001BA72DBD|nr:GNAT family N-acetyltransferase [Nocardiopsis sp. MG754419]MBR8744290.1 GNAT family N-acetyltransferase [Nocardiopsis sp. MG754419]